MNKKERLGHFIKYFDFKVASTLFFILYYSYTLQVAAVSVFAGTDASAAKQVLSTTVAVHRVLEPHLHVADVHMLDNVGPHAAALPHIQVPASQLSALPVQLTKLHGSKIN